MSAKQHDDELRETGHELALRHSFSLLGAQHVPTLPTWHHSVSRVSPVTELLESRSNVFESWQKRPVARIVDALA